MLDRVLKAWPGRSRRVSSILSLVVLALCALTVFLVGKPNGFVLTADQQAKLWRDAGRKLYVADIGLVSVYFSWRVHSHRLVEPASPEDACTCPSREPPQGLDGTWRPSGDLQIPMERRPLKSTKDEGIMDIPIALDNPYLFAPNYGTYDNKTQWGKDTASMIAELGLNGLIAHKKEGFPTDAMYHSVGSLIMQKCLDGKLKPSGKDCKARHVMEIAMEHTFRASHDVMVFDKTVKYDDPINLVHGAAWAAIPEMGKELDDSAVWSEVIAAQLCGFTRMSAGQIRGCIHGVGHGVIMRFLGDYIETVKGGMSTEQKKDPKLLIDFEDLLRRAETFCDAAPTVQLAFECKYGASMKWFLGFAARRGVNATEQLQVFDKYDCLDQGLLDPRCAYPCNGVSAKEGGGRVTNAPAACFSNYFLFSAAGKELEKKMKEGEYGEARVGEMCMDGIGIPHVEDRVGCIWAWANFRFVDYDGYFSRSPKLNESNVRSKLHFLQGSGYADGTITLRNDPDTCDETLDDDCRVIGKPTSLLEFCKELVGAPLDAGTQRVSVATRRYWLACVSGSMAAGFAGLTGAPNVADIVDMYDIPSYIIRHVCSQLRFYLPSDDPMLELLGETAMYMCEESSLYLAVNTNMTFNEYSFWPLDVLACAGASGCVLG